MKNALSLTASLLPASAMLSVPHFSGSGIEALVSNAVQRMITARSDGDRSQISLPILYPSGSGSAVEIVQNGSSLFISDMGMGHLEAEYNGAAEHYDKQAQKAASRFGVNYDGYSVFGLHIPIDQLVGAVISIANASVQAAGAAILKSIEDKERRVNEDVYDRLRSVFTPSLVTRTAEIRGARDTWSAHNVVSFPTGERAVFEYVTKNRNSIASKFTMFSDLSRSDGALSLTAVTHNRSELGPSGAMLEDVANVLELSASNEQFERYAQLWVAA